MKQTSKVIAGVGVLLLLIIVGGVWFLYSNLDSMVAGIIEKEGTDATQTDVNVGSVSIDLRAGTAGITRLDVANPAGFTQQPAISLEGFAIDLDPMAVTSDPLVLERVTVDGARLLVEQTGTRNNLKTILSSLEQMASDQPAAEGETKKLVIERFELTGASAKLLVPQMDQEREVQVPDIVLTDIGRETNGATAASVAQQVLEPMIRMALESAAAGGVRDTIEDKLEKTESDVAEDLLDRLGDQDSSDDDNSEQ